MVECGTVRETFEEGCYRKMLAGHCTYVGDRWFGEDSNPIERMAYLESYNRRRERNWRRRTRRRYQRLAAQLEERLARLPPWQQTAITGRTATWTTESGSFTPVDYRQTYGHTDIGPCWLERDNFISGLLFSVENGVREIARMLVRMQGRMKRVPRPRQVLDDPDERMRIERRKICRRSTGSPCPTATDIRVAWHFVHDSDEKKMRLGRLLMDLECYVNNDLIIKWFGQRPKIIARQPGIRGWIREHCPELVPKYKTLMRYKSMATRARQDAGGMDPQSTPGPTMQGLPIQIQPRDRGVGTPREQRFAWEFGECRVDADGRPFLTNANYSRAIHATDKPPRMDRGPVSIVLNGPVPWTIENYMRDSRSASSRHDDGRLRTAEKDGPGH